MRIRSNHSRVHQCRTLSPATMSYRASQDIQRFKRIRAITLFHVKVRKVLDQPRDVSARGLHFNRNADRVTIVFNEEKNGQLEVRRGIQSLPKLTFAGCSIAERYVGNFVFVKVKHSAAKFI